MGRVEKGRVGYELTLKEVPLTLTPSSVPVIHGTANYLWLLQVVEYGLSEEEGFLSSISSMNIILNTGLSYEYSLYE